MPKEKPFDLDEAMKLAAKLGGRRAAKEEEKPIKGKKVKRNK